MDVLRAYFAGENDAVRDRFSLRDRATLPQPTLFARLHFALCVCVALSILFVCWRIVCFVAAGEAKPSDDHHPHAEACDDSSDEWTGLLPQWIVTHLGLGSPALPPHLRRRLKSRGLSLNPIPEDAALVDGALPPIETSLEEGHGGGWANDYESYRR
ncbi:Aste57867_17019 [Aphanomyces stellatus]|uniref:Aste57867_17019 protein n=1 Tax=Aphanomyces stellatus TaxID=120398 RepID=A0A485L6T4_9STRA|nr:hypothetical protein As57867_016961 [Aphanomyces stellatus]VFT93780.1 Aste57867_17019 [Aphanomyces stellatus]